LEEKGMTKPNGHRPMLLTVREVAELLRIHRPKVYELIKEGTIEGFKLGSDWRVTRESVETLIRHPVPDAFFKKGKAAASEAEAI